MKCSYLSMMSLDIVEIKMIRLSLIISRYAEINLIETEMISIQKNLPIGFQETLNSIRKV